MIDRIAHDETLLDLLTKSARAWARYDSLNAVTGRYFDQDAVDAARAEYQKASAAVIEHDRAFTGWTRYFHVTNTGGHIHRSMSCSTCTPTTSFAFRTDLSDRSVDQAIAEIGPVLCSVCFPDAPVEHTEGVAHAVAAARKEREDAKAEREAKKLTKCLIEGDAKGFIRAGGDRLTTIAAAKSWLTRAFVYGSTHPAFPPADVTVVSEALAARTGKSAAEERAAAQKRAAKY